MRRELSLKKPHLKGEDIKEVQRKLGLKGDAVDGVFGRKTALRVEEWKYRVGYPTDRINSTLGLTGLGFLFGEIEFPGDFRGRAEEQARAEANAVARINRFIRDGEWRISGPQYSARSPLAGLGRVFVRLGRRYGVDPRFLVAIAAHEGRLGTYKPIQPKHNTFGLGPGKSYPSWEANIEAAAENLARQGGFYAGKNTIRKIGLTWAPVGAGNDPDDLNRHWVGSVTRFYGRLGGDEDFDAVVKRRPQFGEKKLRGVLLRTSAELRFVARKIAAEFSSWLRGGPRGPVGRSGCC